LTDDVRQKGVLSSEEMKKRSGFSLSLKAGEHYTPKEWQAMAVKRKWQENRGSES